ncbi:MAG: hypothetical protein IJ618_03860 [Prevotella sp.]|nr:hypothetical protein [Prevotella sp.]
MNRAITIIISLAMTILPVSAKQNDIKTESDARMHHICELYNHDENDSLIKQVPEDLAFNLKHEIWDNYYETWMHLVNTYVFSGQVNTALKEVKLMHRDAEQRGNKYGLALANYAMGNTYINMGYLDESVESYRQSLNLIKDARLEPTTLNDIFSYYCDALDERKEYGALKATTEEWQKVIDRLIEQEVGAEKKEDKGKVWYAYYYLARAQAHLGLNELDEAEEDINEADKRKSNSGNFIPLSVLYYRAKLYLQKKDYQKALELNNERISKSAGVDDKSAIILIQKQRAEIMHGLGKFEEEAQIYKNLMHYTDSIYQKDSRTQINELHTLFKVDELNLETKLERNRSLTITIAVIAIALALLLGYWFWMNHRLRRKNEELAIARDQAQESSRMKTAFIQNVSHEIRTPLNVLSGFSQILAMPDAVLPLQTRQEASEKIQENTNRITTLVNQLLELSDTASRTHLERTDIVPINQLCQRAIAESRIGDTLFYHFTFKTQVDDETEIKTSEHFVVKAIAHLLENAIKFTPENGDIRLNCKTERNLLFIEVEDTGCGVPAEKSEEIFGEFVQLDEYKNGVGIGLSVSRNIARRLGGDITLDTTYTAGARFILTLPLN